MRDKIDTRGITLIALIITIIILLILAGVTIVALTGENGILIRASKAKQETEKVTIIEKIKADIFEEQVKNKGDISESKLNEILTKYDKDGSIKTDGQDEKYILTPEGYTIKVSDIYDGNTKKPSLAEKINASNYGDYIDYNVDLGIDGDQDGDMTDIDDWRIFYKDKNNNIFIIAADYVPNTNTLINNIVNRTGMTKYNIYNVYWNTEPEYKVIDNNIASLFKFGYTARNDYNSLISNPNIKVVSTLLDTSIWNDFATGVTGAKAIGGPTVEMYIASWNEKNYTTLYCNNSNNMGYYIGTTDTPSTSYTDTIIASDKGYMDTLFYPHRAEINECKRYLIASPSAYNNEYILGVYFNGNVGNGNYNYKDYSLRPVVCLPSKTNAIQDQDGIWRIQ